MKAINSFMAVLLVAGCSGPTGPEAIAGHYELVSVHGDSLPITGVHTIACSLVGQCDEVVLTAYGSILLRSDGTYSHNLDRFMLVDLDEEGVFRIDDDQLTFTPHAGKSPYLGRIWRATISGAGITVPDDNFRSGPAVYRR